VIKIERILSRRHIVWIVYACLALRVIMPVGYMPASLADGLPFVLCPDGVFSAGQFSSDAQSSGHHQHSVQDGNGSNHDGSGGGETCQFGSAFGAAAPFTELDQNTLIFEQILVRAVPAAVFRSSIAQPYRARAPPQQLIQA
jgi:hypothetical protein